jgi:hypothetical protein
MDPRKQSIFIWQDFVIGDAGKIVALLKAAGFETAILHHENLAGWRTTSRIALARACQAAGIEVLASAAVYGISPVWEGEQAAAIVKQFALDGFVFDAEDARYDGTDHPNSRAIQLLSAYKAATDKPSVWCWWPLIHSMATAKTYRTFHTGETLKAAMTKADYGMPMAYWEGNTVAHAIQYVEESYNQWRKWTNKPLIMAGRSYVGDNGTPTPAAIRAYHARARELGAIGVTWWSMQHAVKLPEVWSALTGLDQTQEPQEPEETYMYKDKAIGLYTETADWVNPDFDFVIGKAGKGYETPNQNLKAIELKATAEGKPFIGLYQFSMAYYTGQQYPMDPRMWPTLNMDYPMQMFQRAFLNRDVKAIIIEVTDPCDHTGKPGSPSWVSFAAREFMKRAGAWMTENKPGVKLLLGSSSAFIQKYAPAMTSWADEYPALIIQDGKKPLDESYPQASDKALYLVDSNAWELWKYAESLVLFNGDREKMMQFLGIAAVEPKPEPEPVGIRFRVIGSRLRLRKEPHGKGEFIQWLEVGTPLPFLGLTYANRDLVRGTWIKTQVTINGKTVSGYACFADIFKAYLEQVA